MQMSEYDLLERYKEMLDGMFGEVSIAGYSYGTSDALERLDPIAFNEGFANWLDSLMTDGELFEHDGEYYTSEDDFRLVE